jgi:hypothetical protein
MAKTRRLIPKPAKPDNTLATAWQVLAAEAEDALQASDAKPDDDYTRMELFRLVSPLVVELVVGGQVSLPSLNAGGQQPKKRRQSQTAAK